MTEPTFDWSPPTRRTCDNILQTIGNTPMVRLNSLTKGLPCTVFAKVETFNPGNSTKDRMALKMLEDAEEKGLIPSGGTIIEGTSGNTGMGLAIAAVIKGYKCIFTSTDKQSKEKFDLLRAFGAEVIVCPTNVEPEDPRSYYSVSSRLVSETPNSWKANQYDNLANSQAHFESTGPEIWYQTSGKITHLVVGVGTGGTISGCAKYLKQKNPSIQILAIDTYGSALKKYKETGVVDRSEIYPYITEGIGEDFIPKNVAFEYIDHFEKVTDKDACLMTREIARHEGILVGNSAGSAIAGLLQMKDRFKEGDVVVVIFHDHGSRYIGKMFNDEWLIGQGWLEPPIRNGKVAKDLIKKDQKLITVTYDETVEHAYQIISQHGVCQVPVVDHKGAIVGALQDTQLYTRLIDDPSVRQKSVENVMSRPFPTVDPNAALETISRLINKDNNAVMVRDEKTGELHIITKYDIINAMG